MSTLLAGTQQEREDIKAKYKRLYNFLGTTYNFVLTTPEESTFLTLDRAEYNYLPFTNPTNEDINIIYIRASSVFVPEEVNNFSVIIARAG